MSPELKLHVRETLQEKSMGMFLWIELVFKELRKCYSPASVRDCLMELPRDLDEEYFRLFKQVMHRLYGHQSKPSAQTKITRTLLAIIIGAVEPLSIDELRYAYAALCGTDSSWEDLISEDAIFDFLGDFVTCRDERIRFSHASVEEFLTRPLNEWPENQKEIGFFRLDHLECQQLVGSSCLDYLKVIDLGYPIADGSYGDLRHKPFLGYATRHGPLHWTHSLVANPSALPEFDAKLKAFIAMPQFISLVEYITMAMLNDFAFLDDCFHFLLLFEASDSDLLECTVARLHTETARRLAHFGPMDERTSSWKALEGLCVDLFLSRGIAGLTDGLLIDPAKAQLLLQTSVDLSRKPVPTAPTHEIATLASVEPNQPLSHVVRHRRQPVSNPKEAMESIMRSNMTAIMHVPSLSRALKIWTDPAEIRRKLVQAMAEKMPVPLHLLYADRSRTRGDEKMAQSLFESAVRRTEGKTTPYRAPALTGADAFCPYDWDSAVESEEQYRQAYDALLEFQDNPFAHIWMLQVVDARLTSLSYLGRAEERERIVTRSLRDPVASSTRHIRQWRNPLFEHFVYKRKWWIRQVNSRLEGIASTLKDEDVFKDAYRVLESLTERKKLLFGPHHWRVLHSEIDAGNMLLLNWKYLEAEQYFRDVLSSHDDKNLTKGEFLIAVTRFKLAKAVYFQGRHSDAIILFRDAKSHPSKKGCINWHQKCAIFISRCLRRIGEFEAARKELEMIPVEKVIDSLRNGTFLGLKDDELCWNALCNVHLHLDDHESVVAVRTRMHTLLDESLHLVGYKTRNALELVKSLKHMGAFSEAVKHLEELIDRFEGVAKSPNFDIERDRQVLVRARVVVLNALQGLEGSDEANRLRENISRCFLEDLNQYQQKGSVSAPMGTKTDLVVICEASEMAFGLAHEITRRFREYLSICYGKDESLDDEATEPVEIMKEDGDHPQDTDGCGDSNGHVDEDRDLDNNLIQGEVASFEEDLEDDGDRYSDFSVEKVTDEDSGTGHEEPIFETRMGKKFQSFWKLPGRDRD
ncbi:hypothetical protein EV356DRAFT_501516 [Viridothelium virens]|uniref:TPR-like protein n=1 Tax=Viridothelium virens TaxID=1048519 RepID=A0A6A6H9U7_VIRVR|nr:hypothetical protein EV356DRAFT_501516 [Viridothelium virens]